MAGAGGAELLAGAGGAELLAEAGGAELFAGGAELFAEVGGAWLLGGGAELLGGGAGSPGGAGGLAVELLGGGGGPGGPGGVREGSPAILDFALATVSALGASFLTVLIGSLTIPLSLESPLWVASCLSSSRSVLIFL